MIRFLHMPSPIGRLLVAADDAGLRHVEFDAPRYPPPIDATWREEDNDPVLREARRQLVEYFAGSRRAFDLPLAPRGTDFQRRVWDALAGIGFGDTCSYLDIARRLGDPNALRAVGAANGRNPIAIVIPCHRVIGADGSLTGYGGGLERKRFLLELEGALPAGDLFAAR